MPHLLGMSASVSLLELGADPNAVFPDNGRTALHAAAGMRYTDDSTVFITMLLRAGADPLLRARDGRTALEIAQAGAAREASTRDRDDAHRRDFDGIIRLLNGADAVARYASTYRPRSQWV